jgi:glucose dehydrogenase
LQTVFGGDGYKRVIGTTCKRGKTLKNGGSAMRKSAIACGLLASVSFSAPVWANDDVTKLSSDPKNWAIQSGNYAGHRHSKLNQITKVRRS